MGTAEMAPHVKRTKQEIDVKANVVKMDDDADEVPPAEAEHRDDYGVAPSWKSAKLSRTKPSRSLPLIVSGIFPELE
ncbi:unnamed protein product [Phytophthora fragariaefolia]|uniref:Unnamed protein product n=1 Tax=Phytophthora fragariaefolia TaxID=1490495 RepID=A0A9W6XP82_9STRA|nr:unnamed protein product [Phytophthora fragariaefolia]